MQLFQLSHLVEMTVMNLKKDYPIKIVFFILFLVLLFGVKSL